MLMAIGIAGVKEDSGLGDAGPPVAQVPTAFPSGLENQCFKSFMERTE